MSAKKTYNRRDFIRTSAWFTAGALLLPHFLHAAAREKNQLRIVHTNDVHSRIDPFPANDPRYPGMGGFAARAAQINVWRKEDIPLLLVDCGDIVQGTPYFNFFGGMAEIELMNNMLYDAATLGNHEFDNGMNHCATLVKQASFPFVNCNYDFGAHELSRLVKPHLITSRNHLTIGITGVGVNLNGLVGTETANSVKYLNPLEEAEKQALEMKQQGCQFVICLSHLGLEYADKGIHSDMWLAECSSNIDIILGGHTHTPTNLYRMKKNKQGKEVIIGQAAPFGTEAGNLIINIL
jgi:5'-nucleotidase